MVGYYCLDPLIKSESFANYQNSRRVASPVALEDDNE